jgi:hypothetical protein
MTKPLIAVCMPTRGLVFTKTLEGLLSNVGEYDHFWSVCDDLPLPESRNKVVEEALTKKPTHLLLIDDDVVMLEGTLTEMLKSKKPVVIVDYPTHWMGKGEGTGMAVYDQWKEGDSLEGKKMLWAGLGCVLVGASVFEKLPKPYFRKGGQLFDRDKNGKVTLYGIAGGDGGEDYEFFHDLRENGIEYQMLHIVTAGHAKVMKHVGVVSPGKYVKQHDIHVAYEVVRPLK